MGSIWVPGPVAEFVILHASTRLTSKGRRSVRRDVPTADTLTPLALSSALRKTTNRKHQQNR